MDCFCSADSLPPASVLLNITVKGSAVMSARFFTTSGCKLSGPGDFALFSFRSITYIWSRMPSYGAFLWVRRCNTYRGILLYKDIGFVFGGLSNDLTSFKCRHSFGGIWPVSEDRMFTVFILLVLEDKRFYPHSHDDPCLLHHWIPL